MNEEAERNKRLASETVTACGGSGFVEAEGYDEAGRFTYLVRCTGCPNCSRQED